MSSSSEAASGLSVLIPVYNYFIENLISTIFHQLQSVTIPSEIILYDDNSDVFYKKQNRNTLKYQNLIYKELPSNIGRSAIRNIMASQAKYDHLLFLDCDSKICKSNFIATYIDYFQHPVVIGGRTYNTALPEKKFLLHWTVGKAKEVKSLEERQRQPYGCFMFNNILLSKSLFINIGLDNTIKTYGHEDTKFGNILEEKNIPVLHIENPTIHEGLDDNEKFLEKTVEGVTNLYYLTQKGYGRNALLYKVYSILYRVGLERLTIKLLDYAIPNIKKNLCSNNPSLFLFDIFKIYHFIKCSKN